MKRWVMALLLAGCGAGGLAADEAPLPSPAEPRQVTLPGPEGVMLRAWLLVPARPTGPAIIALHGCTGLGPAERPVRLGAREVDWAARLAAAGHPVLFPDSFGSRGLGQACGLRGFPAGPFGARREDALAAAAWARGQDWGGGRAPVLLGWSHGGSTSVAAWATAPAGAIAGAIAFYPGCMGQPPPRGTTPLLMLLGADDDWTRPQPCEAHAALSPAITRVTYPGAHHAFDGLSGGIRSRSLPDGRTVSFGPDAAARTDSRARVMAFLAGLPTASPTPRP